MSVCASTAISSGTVPGSAEDRKLEQSRAGVADMLSELGGDDVAKLSQLAGEATFDRTVDLATAMLAENDLHAAAARPHRGRDHRRHAGAGGALLGHGALLLGAGPA